MPSTDRAILYLRQSTYREDSISLELQEHEGRAYAARNGYEIVAVEADPGVSGRTWNRPAVKRAMEMIANKEAEVIVLWKWSRLSRSRLDWAVAADQVATAGGRIESATEPLDTTTSAGRLARGMLTEFAAFESERIGDVWKESHSRRLRNGLPSTGKPRFGYVYDRDTGFTHDPVTAPVLADAYRSYISGESVYSLVLRLNSGHARPIGGYGVKTDGMWSARTLRRVLDSGFGAGLLNARGELIPGAQEPVISAHEWDAYLEARERRRVYRRSERSEYLFSKLLRCHCGGSMQAGQFGADNVPKYRCKNASEKRAHSGGYVSSAVVEAALMECLRQLADGIDRSAKEQAAERKKPRPVSKPVDYDQRLAAVALKMENLADRLVDPGIPYATYISLRDKYEDERKALEAARRTAAVQTASPVAVVVPELLANWAQFTIPEKRELIRAAFESIIIGPAGTPDRVTFIARA